MAHPHGGSGPHPVIAAKQTVGTPEWSSVTPAKAGVQCQMEGGNAGFPALDPGFRDCRFTPSHTQFVMPAKAGIQSFIGFLDPRFRGGDVLFDFSDSLFRRDDEQTETRFRIRSTVSFAGMTNRRKRAFRERQQSRRQESSKAHVLQPLASRLVAATLLLLSNVGPVHAVSPLEHTKAVLEEARAIVASERVHNDKLKALSELLKTFLDTDTMAKQALDKHWSELSSAQQKEFLTLFRELFQRTYVQKLLLFEKPDFAYAGEELSKDGARVDTKIVTPRDEFAVTYQVRPSGAQWMATDIRIEDLSLTMNFRRQLDRLLSKSSPEDLLNRMRKKYGPDGTGGEDDL